MLASLREHLIELNEQLFSVLTLRQALVSQIREQKNSAWSPERERFIFSRYVKATPDYNVKQDLIYSLIIEQQAGQGYPRWSEGEHLTHAPTQLEQQLNPLLLLERDLASFQNLKLKPEIKEQIL